LGYKIKVIYNIEEKGRTKIKARRNALNMKILKTHV